MNSSTTPPPHHPPIPETHRCRRGVARHAATHPIMIVQEIIPKDHLPVFFGAAMPAFRHIRVVHCQACVIITTVRRIPTRGSNLPCWDTNRPQHVRDERGPPAAVAVAKRNVVRRVSKRERQTCTVGAEARGQRPNQRTMQGCMYSGGGGARAEADVESRRCNYPPPSVPHLRGAGAMPVRNKIKRSSHRRGSAGLPPNLPVVWAGGGEGRAGAGGWVCDRQWGVPAPVSESTWQKRLHCFNSRCGVRAPVKVFAEEQGPPVVSGKVGLFDCIDFSLIVCGHTNISCLCKTVSYTAYEQLHAGHCLLHVPGLVKRRVRQHVSQPKLQREIFGERCSSVCKQGKCDVVIEHRSALHRHRRRQVVPVFHRRPATSADLCTAIIVQISVSICLPAETIIC